MNITHTEYWTEVRSIAEQLAQEAMDQTENDKEQAEECINDCMLHETIDNHQWVIYYAHNLDVLQHSDNAKAYTDCYGPEDIGQLVIDKGVDDLHTTMAFFALEADVRGSLDDALDALISDDEEEQGEG